ncbi:MAG: hypothetical protein K0Q72_4340 [Armatimonadetes bacterium]|nr:hypothetical protein [Armatimonadota bacterium]
MEIEHGESDAGCLRLRFEVGVDGAGGPLGTLHRVLLEAGTRRVWGIAIRSGLFIPRVLRVPLHTLVSGTEERIHLSCGLHGAPQHGPGPDSLVELPDLLRVDALDGPAGRIRELTIDPSSGEILEFVVEGGLFSTTRRRLPAAWVSRISSREVAVEATAAAVARLPHSPGDLELRKAILDSWFYDDFLRQLFLTAPVDVKVREGVATVEGNATSDRQRQRLVMRAHSVPGVREVRCSVISDAELAAAVIEALGDDPRTRGLRPRVQSSLGVISLEGEAFDKTCRAAASEVVAGVPQVRTVINRLRCNRTSAVPADDESWYQRRKPSLLARAWCAFRDLLFVGGLMSGELLVF